MKINEIEKGEIFSFQGKVYKLLDLKHSHFGRGMASFQAKIKDVKTGDVLERTFRGSDEIEEVELEKKRVKFLYSHRGKFVFLREEDKKKIEMKEEEIGQKKYFLTQNNFYDSLWLNEEMIEIVLPPKVDLKVIESPPSFKGNTVQGGTKEVVAETGLKVKVPIFIKEGDIIRVNTSNGEYSQRVKD